MTPTQEQVDFAAQSITDSRAALEATFRTATETRHTADESYAAAVKNTAHMRRCMLLAQREQAAANDQITAALTAAALKAIDSAESGELDLKAYRAIEPVRMRQKHLAEFAREMGEFYLPEAQELELAAEVAKLYAESDQVDGLIAKREFELQLCLVPAMAAEGVVKLDTTHGVTAELRKRAANIRLQAAGVTEKLTELQKTRKRRDILIAQKEGHL